MPSKKSPRVEETKSETAPTPSPFEQFKQLLQGHVPTDKELEEAYYIAMLQGVYIDDPPTSPPTSPKIPPPTRSIDIKEDFIKWLDKHREDIKYATKGYVKKVKEAYEKESGKSIGLTGMRRTEKGLREQLPCLSFIHKKLSRFHPLAPCSDDFINYFIQYFDIAICDLYKEPYNFERTGCVGCPYNIHLQKELDTLDILLPNEKKRCEYIWKEVYSEYRRIGYRLRKS